MIRRFGFSVLLAMIVATATTGCRSGGLEPADRSTGQLPHSRFGESQAPAYERGVVAADHWIASEAGLEMLKLGGNAIDAAVATSFTLAVVRPFSCGLGGGGFMMMHLAEDDEIPARNTVVIYRERAPAAVGPDFYEQLGIEGASEYGPYASGVPGTVAGLLHALDRYGTLDRKVVLAPAIRAAESGFAIDEAYVDAVGEVVDELDERPQLRELIGAERLDWLSERLLLHGRAEVGDVVRQPELANALRLIADKGAAAFYVGDIADAIAEASETIEASDLGRYTVEEAPPLSGTFMGRRVLTMPPPSSGGVAMLQIFGFLERHRERLEESAWNDAAYVHLVVEAMKHAFADRAEWLADAAFTDVPIKRLTSGAYIDELAQRFDPERTYDLTYYGSRAPAPDDSGTSHLSVIDRWGNAVAATETINLEFGSLNVVPEYGLVLNNEMDDFLTIRGEPNAFGLTQSDRNLPAPGKRPLSSMSPTIVLGADGRVEIIAGASGGPRIITGTLQVILNLLLFTDDPAQAVAAARFHHQWAPNRLLFERGWPDVESDGTRDALLNLGHEIGERDDVGVVQVISRVSDRVYAGASDPRKGGQPAGW